MKKIAIVTFILLILPLTAFAQATTTNACTDVAVNNSIGRCVNQIYIWSLGVAALLALCAIVFGGYMTLTAAGNAQRATTGKSYIWSSIIGLVLLFGAYLLLNTINPDLVNFNFTLPNPNASTPAVNPPGGVRQ